MSIDTEKFSHALRQKAIRVDERKLLITRFTGSEQEQDLTEPANCGGLGRIRHFRRATAEGWPENPLPIDPAIQKLGIEPSDIIRAQVFQNAACNWRCWYCFVPFALLNADEKHASWCSVEELLDQWETEVNAPLVIDLTGGQPDLTPEWIPWMMRGLTARGKNSSVYLWSDDNLSNDYFWRYLSEDDIQLVSGYRNYGKVCCFKGFNQASFAFNTKAHPDLFERQFDLFRRYHKLGLDLYAYATFTCTVENGIEDDIRRFVDKLQAVSENMPLRVVPLEIRAFSPVHGRIESLHSRSMKLQWEAIKCWNDELKKRFGESVQQRRICDVAI